MPSSWNRRRKAPARALWIAGLSCSEGPLQEFEAQRRRIVQKGELVYQMYGSIEHLLKVVADARAKGFSYNQIWEKISGSGLPQAKIMLSLDGKGEMRVVLDGAELELNAGLTVPQNAQRYYEKAKELARKAAGAKGALAITEELRSSKAEPRKTRSAHAFRRRKPKWYERFRWFNSSDGFLVLGGRDADSNEEIYAKYLEKRDLALHTDAPGAPLTVIKTEGEEVPESTLQEAAQFCSELFIRLEGRSCRSRLLSDQGRSGQQDPGAWRVLEEGRFCHPRRAQVLQGRSPGPGVGIAEES